MSEPGVDEDERLPFDVELERLPVWAHASSALVILMCSLIAARLVSMLWLLPFLLASSLGKRFASSAVHVEVEAAGLELDGREIPREQIVDVWVDGDEVEPRATVAFGPDVELVVLHFANREQARRFGDALGGHEAAVAGRLPRPVDALASLRYAAIAVAFFANGAWAYAALGLVFFGVGAWTLARAKQIVARPDGVTIRGPRGAATYAYEDLAEVDVEAGALRVKDGPTVRVPRGALRDATLASPKWLDRARGRILARVARAARSA